MTVRVLIVDDVTDLRLLVKLSLRLTEFEVVGEAADGLEAIAAAERYAPDLVLLDLSMPNMDGLEALPRLLRAAPRSAVVILSGFGLERMGPVALGLGAAAYVEKGLSPTDLVAKLRLIMRDLRATTGDGDHPQHQRIPHAKASPAEGASARDRLAAGAG